MTYFAIKPNFSSNFSMTVVNGSCCTLYNSAMCGFIFAQSEALGPRLLTKVEVMFSGDQRDAQGM